MSCILQVIMFTATRFYFEIEKEKKKTLILFYFHDITTFILAELMSNLAGRMTVVEVAEKILTMNSDLEQ